MRFTLRAVMALLVAGALSPVILSSTASADTWPSRPVRVIVPYAAGGSGDAVARPWAEKLSHAFGQQFVVENKTGASGTIGAEAAARAPADGYTLLASPHSALTLVPQLRKTAYDLERDFQAVGRTGDMIAGVVLAPNVPANSVAEFLDLARKAPDEFTCGSAGLGTQTHMRCELFPRRGGVRIRHIPYRGSAESLNDLLGGHISMMTESNALPQAKAGKIKIIAIVDDQRHPDFPNVPTLAEAGMPDFGPKLSFGIFAPKQVPREIVLRLNEEVRRIAQTEEMRARLLGLGMRAVVMTADEMQADLKRETAMMGALIKELDFRVE